MVFRRRDETGTLFSCSLVCRAWSFPCQRLLFSWVIFREWAEFDNFFHLYRASGLSHISFFIRRISILYERPCHKLGEVLPRIAIMAPPNLIRIDINRDFDIPYPPFPFHDSFASLLRPLYYVRVLHIRGFMFSSFSELRQLISCFPGLQSLSVYWGSLSTRNAPDIDTPLQWINNPFLTRILIDYHGRWSPQLSHLFCRLWLYHRRDYGIGRCFHYRTAHINRAVPMVSPDLAVFMQQITDRHTALGFAIPSLRMKWKLENCLSTAWAQCEFGLSIV